MTDLIQQLREHADSFNDDGACDNPGAHPDLYRDAANALEQLSTQANQPSPVPQVNPPGSLRDWFAGMYLQGAIAGNSLHDASIANNAYTWADRMMEARVTRDSESDLPDCFRRIEALVRDPHPGLSTWVESLQNQLQRIFELAGVDN